LLRSSPRLSSEPDHGKDQMQLAYLLRRRSSIAAAKPINAGIAVGSGTAENAENSAI
jgi:hypothetical protein